MIEYSGHSSSDTDLRLGMVCSRYHTRICSDLYQGALDALDAASVDHTQLVKAQVPGVYEIPSAMEWLLRQDHYEALIVLGCVIRGETFNFELIGQGLIQGIESIRARYQVPVGYGVLTVDTMAQAEARSGLRRKERNKGWEAAQAAIEMARLFRLQADISLKTERR